MGWLIYDTAPPSIVQEIRGLCTFETETRKECTPSTILSGVLPHAKMYPTSVDFALRPLTQSKAVAIHPEDVDMVDEPIKPRARPSLSLNKAKAGVCSGVILTRKGDRR